MASRAFDDDSCARPACGRDPSAARGSSPARNWFSAAELAALALPGLPADKRSIARRAKEERWSVRHDSNGELLVRRRRGHGGGLEFHVALLPPEARLELSRRGHIAERPAPEAIDATAAGWRWYERQKASVRRKAEERLAIVREVETLEQSGMNRTAAIAAISARHAKASESTLWNWLSLVDGVPPQHRLPALAPRYQGGGREADIDSDLWRIYASDRLRPSPAPASACYDRVAEIATERGLSIPSEATFRRRFKRDYPRKLVILRKEGPEKLRRSVPAQRRTVDHLHALDIVNVDGHKFDVAVTPPGGGEAVRPIMVAIQDVRSSKVLSWCIDLSENSIQTQLAFRDLFRDYGLPRAVLLDNGRAFASKKISGGAKTRFRFKIKPDEPTGVLVALDINPMWALPYRGQSKPVERAFRDMCERIAMHPATEGAYTGNSPAKKPHNHGSRAMAWDEFVAHVEQGILRHNAQVGRRGRDYNGRSFDQVFAESYAAAPGIRKAGPAELRMALLTAKHRRTHRETGEIELFGNRYWTPELHDHAGEKVIVRFDPEDLHSEVHVFDIEGAFLLVAPLLEDSGFDSEAGARATAKRAADVRKAARKLEELEGLYEAHQIAAMLPKVGTPEVPEARVLRPVRHRSQTAAALKAVPDAKVQIEAKRERESRVFNALRLIGGDE